ncbi:MAG: MATE family efflux transporter [Actinomycetia bacterium]|nr:MATE family efflux transporter [Actinomycetes bacterium]
MDGLKLRSDHDRAIARLAIPALGTLVAEPLYVLADTAIVGHLGTSELAGLALATTVLLSVYGLLIFLAYGTTASVARLMGAGDVEKAARVSVQALWLAAIIGLAVAAGLVATATPLLELLGGSGQALVAGRTYLVISSAGVPFLLLTLAGAGAFHGRQDTRTPLVIAVSSAVANLVLESILVFGLDYGIGASALSTVLAQAGAGLVYTNRGLAWARSLGLSLAPVATLLRQLLIAGQPLMLRNLALRGSFTLATAMAARIGEVELAAHQVGVQIWSTLALALDAVAIAGQALTGHWLGAGEAIRAREAAKRMIEIDVAVGVVAGLVILVARHPIASIFSSDPGVVATVAYVLVFVAVVEPINGYVFALDGILIGAGDLRYLGRSMSLAAVIFMIMAALLLNSETLFGIGPLLQGRSGLGWLWTTLGLFMGLRGLTLWWRWRSDHWIVTGAEPAPDGVS